jgi:hypothetical protein
MMLVLVDTTMHPVLEKKGGEGLNEMTKAKFGV